MKVLALKQKMLIAAIALFALGLLVLCSEKSERYQPLETLPSYQPDSQPQDGDTQADTIKALQAYAKAAVGKSTELNQRTEQQLMHVLENKQRVEVLQQENQQLKTQQQTQQQHVQALQDQLTHLQQQLTQHSKPSADDSDLPVGFGFNDLVQTVNPNQGTWYDPLDRVNDKNTQDNNQQGFQRLLQPPRSVSVPPAPAAATKPAEDMIKPVYTLPKDTILTDAVALTALIGRIPVSGTTPDPYPVKFFIGKENLAANGHQIPEVAGMLLSGLGFGDWNLSCVNARLTSATFIFNDGTIVNHTQTDQPLGYISDPSGIPCVAGKFVSNAPAFLLQRAGLAGLGTAGSAYAEAQQQTQTSALTGTTTSTVLGDIEKMVAGDMVQSATDEISRWLLARQQQSFDAVIVNPGVSVAIHLQASLTLDHLSTARKVRYAQTQDHQQSHLD